MQQQSVAVFCTAACIHQINVKGEAVGSSTALERLMEVIEDRKRNQPAKSYTTQLLSGGVSRIGEKISEEAREVVEAAGESGAEGKAHLIYEAADLVYHLLVMLAYRDVRLSDLEEELGRRFGVSGLEEKASRGE